MERYFSSKETNRLAVKSANTYLSMKKSTCKGLILSINRCCCNF